MRITKYIVFWRRPTDRELLEQLIDSTNLILAKLGSDLPPDQQAKVNEIYRIAEANRKKVADAIAQNTTKKEV